MDGHEQLEYLETKGSSLALIHLVAKVVDSQEFQHSKLPLRLFLHVLLDVFLGNQGI
ncbi:hypothetical protein HanRHA438_Chr09g0383721 [Helianthus annuus]|nr:hypothetical protein HanHA300_Chr09g0305441 [Helianthus annuus]KAJ0541232.1 hypothetical protein HanHA89_Chr09g0326051 [Helianthus annuus]KAJ0706314.1 hypothetical protein HanLR1_Chr09g0305551 [Helianthus annuus]KAJ0710363.1 hypothetical protein HanOQP8_Chr09g0311491 [Helianthus annuus]KAJ0886818.1 hypothetical protein HanRHA438_Chr09g0383721 [Helianthus annuus]